MRPSQSNRGPPEGVLGGADVQALRRYRGRQGPPVRLVLRVAVPMHAAALQHQAPVGGLQPRGPGAELLAAAQAPTGDGIRNRGSDRALPPAAGGTRCEGRLGEKSLELCVSVPMQSITKYSTPCTVHEYMAGRGALLS